MVLKINPDCNACLWWRRTALGLGRPSDRSVCSPGRGLGPISLFAGFGFFDFFIDNVHGTACYRNIGVTNIPTHGYARYIDSRR